MAPRNKRKRLLRGLQIKMKTNEDKKKNENKSGENFIILFCNEQSNYALSLKSLSQRISKL